MTPNGYINAGERENAQTGGCAVGGQPTHEIPALFRLNALQATKYPSSSHISIQKTPISLSIDYHVGLDRSL